MKKFKKIHEGVELNSRTNHLFEYRSQMGIIEEFCKFLEWCPHKFQEGELDYLTKLFWEKKCR